MTSDEHKPASMPDDVPREPPRWERRLGDALRWYLVVLVGEILLGTGALFNIHLGGTLQQLAYVVFTAEFVAFLLAGFILLVRAMRRNPATSRPWVWGTRLLVTGSVGLGVLLTYLLITNLLVAWHRSTTEELVLTVLGALVYFLLSLGLVLVSVAIIGEFRQWVRSRNRRPPSDSSA